MRLFQVNALPLLASAFVAGLGVADPDFIHKHHLEHLKKEIIEHGYHEAHEHGRKKQKVRKKLAYV